ncbi:MAG: hypothetical protein ABFD15_08625 [Methanofastidiosum sp.]|jgi:hypothetical protein|nr:hypothetical protein [Methanofastidiosum sp.]HII94612.1 hypothetical protein [Methanofastidiosum sp.]
MGNVDKIVLSDTPNPLLLKGLSKVERKEKIKRMLMDWFSEREKGFISEAAEELGIEYEEAFEAGKELISGGYLS